MDMHIIAVSCKWLAAGAGGRPLLHCFWLPVVVQSLTWWWRYMKIETTTIKPLAFKRPNSDSVEKCEFLHINRPEAIWCNLIYSELYISMLSMYCIVIHKHKYIATITWLQLLRLVLQINTVNNAIQSNGQEEPSKSLFTMLAKPNHPISYKCKV